jgi:hypothetical protein
MLVAAVIILAGVVVVASGRGGEMAPDYPDYPPIDLGPVTAADVVMLRPPSAAWGYNMRVTDEALEAIARAVTERDVRISALEQEVSDLRGQAGGHPPEAQPAIQDPAAGPAAPPDDTVPAWPPGEEEAAGEPGPEESRYGAPAHEEAPYPAAAAYTAAAAAGDNSPCGPVAEEEAPSETTGHADAGQEEPAYEAAAHGQPPQETASYADAAHEDPAYPEAGQDLAWRTSQHETWEAAAQPSAWEPARPHDQARDDNADHHDPGPVTDPDLPRVPANAADLSRPPSFWDTAAEPSAAPPAAEPSAAPPAGSRAAGDEPDAKWDERPHQTLVWGVAHQRAKATRIQEQDLADQDAARQHEDSQDAPGPAGYDAPGPAGYEEARQPAGSEHDHE